MCTPLCLERVPSLRVLTVAIGMSTREDLVSEFVTSLNDGIALPGPSRKVLSEYLLNIAMVQERDDLPEQGEDLWTAVKESWEAANGRGIPGCFEDKSSKWAGAGLA